MLMTDSDDSDTSVSTVKSLHDYDGKLGKLQRCCLWNHHSVTRQLQFSQVKEMIQLGGNSALLQ